MAELQVSIELSVELNKFFNVDLFQRGYYQVQVHLKTALKSLARVEVSDSKINAQKDLPDNTDAFKQSCVGKSRKFQVLYRNEEVNIGNVFIFKVHTLVESTKLEKNVENLDLRLDVQLWCNDEDELMEADAKMELASSRTLLLHLSPTKGLHHFLPVLFDYFHLSALTVVIHGTIIAIHQPYLVMPKSHKAGKSTNQSTLEAVYFGQKVTAAAGTPSSVGNSSVRLQQAHLMHKTICNILLSAHESLQDYLQQYAALIPGNNFTLASKNCLTRLGETLMKVQGVLEEDDLIQTAQTDITQLGAENVLLWTQFLEIVLKQPQVHFHLALQHHSQRVRRFAEGFFTLEHNKSSCLSCYDPGFHGHSSLASIVKSSAYYCNLPSLSVECVELDGDENSLPIIFEDIYRDTRASPPQVYHKTVHTVVDGSIPGLSHELSSSTSSSSSLASDRITPPHLRKRLSAKNFIKNMKPEGLKRPSTYYCKNTEVKPKGVPMLPSGVTLTGYRRTTEPDATDAGTISVCRLGRTQSLTLSSNISTALKSKKEASQQDVQSHGIVSTNNSHLASTASNPGLSSISGNHSINQVPASSSLHLTSAISDPHISNIPSNEPRSHVPASSLLHLASAISDPHISNIPSNKPRSHVPASSLLHLASAISDPHISNIPSNEPRSHVPASSPLHLASAISDPHISNIPSNEPRSHVPASSPLHLVSAISDPHISNIPSNDSRCHVPATNSNLARTTNNPDLSNICNHNSMSNITASSSATLTQSPNVFLKDILSSSSDTSLTIIAKSTAPPTNDSIVSPTFVNKSHHSSSLTDYHSNSELLPLAAVQESLASNSLQLCRKELNNLVDDISQALGEKEPSDILTADTSSNNDNLINNHTYIANGFDELLYVDKQDFSSSSKLSSYERPSVTADLAARTSESENHGLSVSPLDDQFSNNHVLHSRNNNSASRSEISSQEEIIPSLTQSVTVSLNNTTTTMMSISTTMTASLCVTDSFTDTHQKVNMTNIFKEKCRKSVNEGFDSPPVVDSSSIQLYNYSSTSQLAISSSATHLVNPSSKNQLPISSSATHLDKPSTTVKLPISSSAQLDKPSTTVKLVISSSATQLDNTSSIIQLDDTDSSLFSSHRAASDSDILKNSEEKQKVSQKESKELLISKASSNGNDKRRALLSTSSSYPELSQSVKSEQPRLVSVIGRHTVNFVQLRECLKLEMNFPGYLYSECPLLASSIPYFHVPTDIDESSFGIHLIICVHGLDGNSADLRLVRTYIEMALPGFKLDFLMSENNQRLANIHVVECRARHRTHRSISSTHLLMYALICSQQDTFANFDKMTDKLVAEILIFLSTCDILVSRISFVGHSLGNIIIRSALTRPEMSHLLPKLYTMLSLSGPHLGALYNSSGLVNMGMWFMQKWKKSGSLLQLSLKDHSDPRQTFLYKLSQKPVLQHFKHVLLVASHQDRYVPYHSSRIEICRSAQKDTTVTGSVYKEMVQNILEPIIQSPYCTLIRYDVFHTLPSTANTMIGRAAHIAVLDSEIFIEKFLSVTGLKYFQ